MCIRIQVVEKTITTSVKAGGAVGDYVYTKFLSRSKSEERVPVPVQRREGACLDENWDGKEGSSIPIFDKS